MRLIPLLALAACVASPAAQAAPLKVLFPRRHRRAPPGGAVPATPARLRPARHRADLHRRRRVPRARDAQAVRRADGLRQHRGHHAQSREGATRLRRGGRGVPAAALHLVRVPELAEGDRARGAQFRSHQTGVFRAKIVAPDHPVMKGSPASRVGTRPTSTSSTTRSAARCWRRGPRGTWSSRGPGSASRGRGACSTPPGGTTTGPGATPGSWRWSSAGCAGRPRATRPRAGRTATPRQ